MSWEDASYRRGAIMALCFELRIEDARDEGAYLGLVLRRDETGNTDKQLLIRSDQQGGQWLFEAIDCKVCAPWAGFFFGVDSELRRGGLKLAERSGKVAKKRATIAVARRLAVLMLTLWDNQAEYEPLRIAVRMEA